MKTEYSLSRVTSSKPFIRSAARAARLLPVLTLLSLPAAAEAEINLSYTTNNGTIVITGCSGSDVSLVIPGAINGRQVTSIGDNAFYNQTQLAGVTIPDSITRIGAGAFGWCAALTNVTISTNLTSIGDQAFYNCGKLAGITLPNSLTNLGNSAFNSCSSLAAIAIPNRVTAIGTEAFYKCSSLTNVTLPRGATAIGDTAFGRCVSLANISIPNGVTSIGPWAFYSCSNLTSITIPDSVASIGDAAFYCCVSLAHVTIPNGVSSLSDSTFYSCASLTNVTIPASVSAIGNQVFYSCVNLAGISIPNGVAKIGSWAFYSCVKLTNIVIPSSLTSLDYATFYSCSNLANVTIPSGIAKIGDYAFCSCGSLSNVYFAGDAPSVGSSVFTGDNATIHYLPGSAGWGATFGGRPTSQILAPYTYTSSGGTIAIIGYVGAGGAVRVPSAIAGLPVTSIGDQAFYNSARLTSVTIPSSVTNIGNGAFSGCANLVAVYCRGNAPGVGASVFLGDNKATVYRLPEATGWGTTFSDRPVVKWASASPKITSQPRDVSLIHGSDATFHVAAATNGMEGISYQWLRDGAPLAESASIAGTASDTLVIHQTRLQSAGSYSVTVTAGLSDVASRNALLIVKADAPKLRIIAPISNQRVSNNAFSTSVSGVASDNLGIGSIRVSVRTNSWMAATVNSWTNWQTNVVLTPGENWIVVHAQDLDGVSTSVSNKVILVVSDILHATANCGGTTRNDLITPDLNGSLLEIGRAFRVTAAPWPGCRFLNWTGGFSGSGTASTNVLTNSTSLSFVMQPGLAVQANYMDVTQPTVGILNPANRQQWGYASMPINGWAQDNIQLAGVNYRINSNAWTRASGAENWNGIANLADGTNTVDAYAEDAAGNHSLTNTVKVIYNRFLAVSGSYYGLFSASNRLHGSSGFVKLTVTDRASYSGAIVGDGRTNSLSGIFDRNGFSVKNVTRPGTNPVTVMLALDLAVGANQISGTLSNAGWVASLRADRAAFNTTNPCPFKGGYTMVIPGEEASSDIPSGYGYGIVTVDANGTVVLSGGLGDGAPLGQSGSVSQDGRWPFYASLYGGKGSAYGWLSFTNSSSTEPSGGNISWIKPTLGAATKFYPAGFTFTNQAAIARYSAPLLPTTRVMNMTNGIVSFADGDLVAPFTKQVTLTVPHNRFAGTNSHQLTFNLTTASGFFSGTAIDPATKAVIAFKGALLQDRASGYGYFLGTNKSGSVSLSPAP